jgi:hypothetical protein
MTGPNMGGARPGAGRPRKRWVFQPAEMVAVGVYDAAGNMQRIDYCTADRDPETGNLRLLRHDGGWYELGNLPRQEAHDAS